MNATNSQSLKRFFSLAIASVLVFSLFVPFLNQAQAGSRIFEGDFTVRVKKFVSLDGENYRMANTAANSVTLPGNRETRVYTKIRIENPNHISARDVEFRPFLENEGELTLGEIENIKRATVNEQGNIVVNQVKGNQAVVLSYSRLVNTGTPSRNATVDGVELVNFRSGTKPSFDRHTYLGMGQQFKTYLSTGTVAASTTTTPSMPSTPVVTRSQVAQVASVSLRSDKTVVKVGDMVRSNIVVENRSDENLTNVSVAYSYPAGVEVVSATGARDSGSELSWNRAMLRPGERVTYQFETKIVSGEAGSRLRTLARVLTSEHQGIAPAEATMVIAGSTAAQPVVTPAPTREYQLASTGPAHWMLLMIASLLATMGLEKAYRKEVQ